jgi:hypothetical protein
LKEKKELKFVCNDDVFVREYALIKSVILLLRLTKISLTFGKTKQMRTQIIPQTLKLKRIMLAVALDYLDELAIITLIVFEFSIIQLNQSQSELIEFVNVLVNAIDIEMQREICQINDHIQNLIIRFLYNLKTLYQHCEVGNWRCLRLVWLLNKTIVKTKPKNSDRNKVTIVLYELKIIIIIKRSRLTTISFPVIICRRCRASEACNVFKRTED